VRRTAVGRLLCWIEVDSSPGPATNVSGGGYGFSRYIVARSTPNVRATSATASPALILSSASRRWCADNFFGRPKRTPRAFARSRPSLGSDSSPSQTTMSGPRVAT
jgi:hypothetical protein